MLHRVRWYPHYNWAWRLWFYCCFNLRARIRENFPLARENIRFSSLFGDVSRERRARRKGCFRRLVFLSQNNLRLQKRSLCTVAPPLKKIGKERGGCTQATKTSQIQNIYLKKRSFKVTIYLNSALFFTCKWVLKWFSSRSRNCRKSLKRSFMWLDCYFSEGYRRTRSGSG